uniref:Hes family bHLH transcription factor 1 n=1 Tax=Varanus komodoensis TaxID=61221 RepID=A0A8D2JGE8_VARKO
LGRAPPQRAQPCPPAAGLPAQPSVARLGQGRGGRADPVCEVATAPPARESPAQLAGRLGADQPGARGARAPCAVLNTDPTVLGKYRAGFSECMNEVTRFLSTCEGVNTEVRTRLLAHLASCMSQINAMNYPAPPPAGLPPGAQPGAPFGQPLVQIPAGAAPPAGSVGPCKLGSAAGETAKVYGGFQLVPASDGQFAFLIPSTAFVPHSSAVLPVYAGGGAGSGLPSAVALSPGSGVPSLPADSVWRPW